jgi:hypothetical protein
MDAFDLMDFDDEHDISSAPKSSHSLANEEGLASGEKTTKAQAITGTFSHAGKTNCSSAPNEHLDHDEESVSSASQRQR